MPLRAVLLGPEDICQDAHELEGGGIPGEGQGLRCRRDPWVVGREWHWGRWCSG